MAQDTVESPHSMTRRGDFSHYNSCKRNISEEAENIPLFFERQKTSWPTIRGETLQVSPASRSGSEVNSILPERFTASLLILSFAQDRKL